MASHALSTPVSHRAFSAEAGIPAVLVVDRDPRSVSHCSEMLAELGYPHHGATSARHAFEAMGSVPSIQILLANVQMPSIDGFALIEEARIRAGHTRPIAAIMVAEQATVEMAVRGLHVEAVDLLSKPLTFDAYSTALRRAMRYLSARRPQADGGGMNGFGEQITRLVAALEGKSSDPAIDGQAGDKEVAITLRKIIALRSMRGRHFLGELFADPAWDILLDLARAELEGQQVSVSSVCIAASVPMSTALRWVRQMTEAGLLRRWTDPKDRRRDLIALTESTASSMRDYLAAAAAALKKF